MKHLAKELSLFSSQIKFAIDNYKTHGVEKDSISNIIICGMGASGIAGKIVKSYFLDKIDLPIEIVADYNLPRFAGKNTLAIFCSYSGNTEEVVSAYEFAHQAGCKNIIISCGGKLKDLAVKNHEIIYNVPSGNWPRTALGAPLTYLFLILFDLLGQYKNADLTKIVDYVVNYEDFIQTSADLVKSFNNTLKNKFVIVTDSFFEGVANRFAQQLQENAKTEAFVVVLPEANHNVIETYYSRLDTNYIFLNSRNNQRTNLRFAFVKDLLVKDSSTLLEVLIKDASINTLFYTIYQLDWMSLHIADKLGADSSKLSNLVSLKDFLHKK